jgi:hypothetical protein
MGYHLDFFQNTNEMFVFQNSPSNSKNPNGEKRETQPIHPQKILHMVLGIILNNVDFYREHFPNMAYEHIDPFCDIKISKAFLRVRKHNICKV